MYCKPLSADLQGFIDYYAMKEKEDSELKSRCESVFSSKYLPHWRRMTVEWMFEALKWAVVDNKTYFYAVNYFDRAMTFPCEKNEIQLVATVCLVIASKFNDVNYLGYSEIDDVYHVDDMVERERIILGQLDSRLNVVTPIDYLEMFCAISTMPEKFVKFVEYLLHLLQLEHGYVNMKSSTMVIACIAAAAELLCEMVDLHAMLKVIGMDEETLVMNRNMILTTYDRYTKYERFFSLDETFLNPDKGGYGLIKSSQPLLPVHYTKPEDCLKVTLNKAFMDEYDACDYSNDSNDECMLDISSDSVAV